MKGPPHRSQKEQPPANVLDFLLFFGSKYAFDFSTRILHPAVNMLSTLWQEYCINALMTFTRAGYDHIVERILGLLDGPGLQVDFLSFWQLIIGPLKTWEHVLFSYFQSLQHSCRNWRHLVDKWAYSIFHAQCSWRFLFTVSKVAINIFAEGILVAVWSPVSFVVTGRSSSHSNMRSSSPNASLRAGQDNPYLKNGKDRNLNLRSDPSSIVCGFLGGTIARSVYISANSCRTKASFYSLNTPNERL